MVEKKFSLRLTNVWNVRGKSYLYHNLAFIEQSSQAGRPDKRLEILAS